MSVDGELLEQIVRGVLHELGGAAPNSDPPKTNVPHVPKELVLTEKVITAELLEKRWSGAPRLRIGSASVVTPSARDFLRQHNLECVRASAGDRATSELVKWKALVVSSTKTLEEALADAARRADAHWTRALADGDDDAVERGVSALCRGEAGGVMIFTTRGASVACRANRNPRVRAAAIAQAGCIRAAREDLGANLYAVNPAGRSLVQLRNILREAANGPAPLPPQHWNESR